MHISNELTTSIRSICEWFMEVHTLSAHKCWVLSAGCWYIMFTWCLQISDVAKWRRIQSHKEVEDGVIGLISKMWLLHDVQVPHADAGWQQLDAGRSYQCEQVVVANVLVHIYKLIIIKGFLRPVTGRLPVSTAQSVVPSWTVGGPVIPNCWGVAGKVALSFWQACCWCSYDILPPGCQNWSHLKGMHDVTRDAVLACRKEWGC